MIYGWGIKWLQLEGAQSCNKRLWVEAMLPIKKIIEWMKAYKKKHENLKSLGIFRSSNGIIKNQINDH